MRNEILRLEDDREAALLVSVTDDKQLSIWSSRAPGAAVWLDFSQAVRLRDYIDQCIPQLPVSR